MTLTPGIGQAGKTTVFVRRRDPAVGTEPGDRFNQVIAITSRCAHVGCPVAYVDAARSFVCPCHGGVYDFRGRRVGGPPPRPLDRYYTRVRDGRVELGPRYSVNSELRRFSRAGLRRAAGRHRAVPVPAQADDPGRALTARGSGAPRCVSGPG